jgi:hypothetical protein
VFELCSLATAAAVVMNRSNNRMCVWQLLIRLGFLIFYFSPSFLFAGQQRLRIVIVEG